MYKRILKLVHGDLHVCKRVLKLVQGALRRVQKGIEVGSSRAFLRSEQFGLEVTSSRFCVVYNLGMKLLQVDFAQCTIWA